jgi:hypothetical protein
MCPKRFEKNEMTKSDDGENWKERIAKESGLMKRTALILTLILALLSSTALFDISSVFAVLSPEPTTSPTPTPSQEPTSTPETQQPPHFPTALVIALIITITVEGIGLLIYFKKRKH